MTTRRTIRRRSCVRSAIRASAMSATRKTSSFRAVSTRASALVERSLPYLDLRRQSVRAAMRSRRWSRCFGRGTCDFVYADYFHFSELDEATGEPLEAAAHQAAAGPAARTGQYRRRVLPLHAGGVRGCRTVRSGAIPGRGLRLLHPHPAAFPRRTHPGAVVLLQAARRCALRARDMPRSRPPMCSSVARTDYWTTKPLRTPVRTSSCAISGACKNPLLRAAYSFVRDGVFQTDEAVRGLVRSYVLWKIKPRISKVLEGFASKSLTFR